MLDILYLVGYFAVGLGMLMTMYRGSVESELEADKQIFKFFGWFSLFLWPVTLMLLLIASIIGHVVIPTLKLLDRSLIKIVKPKQEEK